MASEAISLEVITPEQQVVKQVTDSVVLPAHDGELGVLSNRAPLLCELGVGQLRYRAEGVTKRMFVDGGFAQIHDNRVTVLTNEALSSEQVTADVLTKTEQRIEETRGISSELADAHRRAQNRLTALRSVQRG